ncbi:MAG: UDP-N-acetylglucosamine 4-epimerase [Alphaproteobacteria bacterium MarineAlpha4_Bin2]|nr:MAG: UDP-N-acetylglucosamine 4-epimerase [Alphaproteobacteria bacterium MarineAlpha4_Bin2]
MAVLVTGAAGFIGYHTVDALLERGERVIGVDNFNDYYDVSLKEARFARLRGHPDFVMHRINISDRASMENLRRDNQNIDAIIHLAAQAGVRYSLENPYAYIEANILGQMVILELARHLPKLRHLVYASSSSVYGGNTKLPFALEDPVDQPVSLYAATKRADELMGYCYSHLYNIPMTGLRFFTVYGRWGRPDMAAYIFTKAILDGQPIKVFNHGKMKRDFTHISDIVTGILACLDQPPSSDGYIPHRLYNLGNNTPEPLMRFIELIERSTNHTAKIDFQPMQPGDVKETYADIESSRRDFNFAPKTSIDEGISDFVDWYREYHGV